MPVVRTEDRHFSEIRIVWQSVFNVFTWKVVTETSCKDFPDLNSLIVLFGIGFVTLETDDHVIHRTQSSKAK